jgi:hypothetical protein
LINRGVDPGEIALTCPQCGGDVRPLDEPGFLDCAYCGSRLHQDAALPDTWVTPVLGEAHAIERLKRLLESRETAGQPTFARPQLLFFPFWERPGPHGMGIEPAAATLAEALDGWNPPFGQRRPLDARSLRGRGEQIAPTLEPPQPGAALLYVPFWAVSYTCGALEHKAWIEAVSGTVLVERLPPSRNRRLDAAYSLWLVVTGIVLTIAFALLWNGGPGALVGLLVLIALGPLAVRWGRSTILHLERKR